MVDAVNIVFEGSSQLRRGFSQLFELHVGRARLQRLKVNLIAGGSKMEAIKNFMRYCSRYSESLNVLLVDSDGPVTGTTQYLHNSLHSLSIWGSDTPCSDEQVHLMIQAMEAWFAADPQSLRRHFGRNFNVRALPSPQSAEVVSAADLLTAIRRGLPQNRRRRGYDKVSDGVELLGLIDPDVVSQHCGHFRRLWTFPTVESSTHEGSLRLASLPPL